MLAFLPYPRHLFDADVDALFSPCPSPHGCRARPGAARGVLAPSGSMQLTREGDCYVVSAALPGVRPDEISCVEVVGNRTVRLEVTKKRPRAAPAAPKAPAPKAPAPDATGIEVLSWFIIVVVAARGACFQRVHGGELWRLPEARPFLAEVTPPKRHTAHRREGTRGAAQTVQVSTAAQGGGADTSGQQRGAGAWRALPGAFLTILHVDVSFQA